MTVHNLRCIKLQNKTQEIHKTMYFSDTIYTWWCVIASVNKISTSLHTMYNHVTFDGKNAFIVYTVKHKT